MAKVTSKGGIASLAAIAGKKAPAKAQSTVPTVDAPQSIRPAIAKWIEAKNQERTAEADRKAAESALTEVASQLRIERCRKDREVHPSICLNGGPFGTIKAVQADRYKKMRTEEHQDALLSIFGDQEFEKFFRVRMNFIIDADKLAELPNGDKIAAKLAEALGAEAAEILKVESVIEPTEQYTNAMVLDEKVARKADDAIADGHAVPIAMSFRL